MSLGANYPVSLTGTLTLSFTPDPVTGLPATGYVDPGLAFAVGNPGSGGLQTNFTIPAGTTGVALPSSSIQVGSVAGTITVTLTGLKANVNGQAQQLL